MKDTLCIVVLMREQITELHVNCVYLGGVHYDMYVLQMLIYKQKKLRGLSPRANYTDRAAAAGRRS